ncbi:MAG: hypothetical protein R3F44_09390 [Candidatus Competibacteraceae bacterium]
MIILAMVSAGGALTMAAGGRLSRTRLAEVLETWIKRNPGGSDGAGQGSEDRAMSGSARRIEKLLTKALEDR